MTKTPQRPNRRKRPKIRLHFRVALFLSAVFAVMWISSGWSLWQQHVQMKEQLVQLNREKAALLQQKSNLMDEIELLNTPAYIEKLAREQLGLVKKGEILISPKN